MQQGGTLKKRRRKTIAKVTKRQSIPKKGKIMWKIKYYYYRFYNVAKLFILNNFSCHEDDNVFDLVKNEQRSNSKTENGYTTVIIPTSAYSNSQNKSAGVLSSRSRPTRNPLFHRNLENVVEIEEAEPDCDSNYTKEKIEWEANDRSYLFDKQTMSRLKQILFLAMTSFAVPWKWDNKNKRINSVSPTLEKAWKLFQSVFLIQILCMLGAQVYRFWQMASSRDFTNRELFMFAFNMGWCLQMPICTVSTFLYEAQMREYINTLLKYNHEMVDKFIIHLEGHKEGGRLLMNFGIVSDLSAVFLPAMHFLKMPNAPEYLFSYIHPKPWYWRIPGAIQVFVLAGQVLFFHTIINWVMTSHTNTVQFWLTEIHKNYYSGYTTNELRKRSTSLEVFKSLQVLSNCFNECMSPLFIPIIKVQNAILIILGGYVTIRSLDYFVQEFPQSLIFLMGAINCGICAFVMLKMSSQLFDLGCGFIDSWGMTREKDFRKVLLGCPTLKVQVRRFYFITVSTTVLFFKIVWDNIINVLITFA